MPESVTLGAALNENGNWYINIPASWPPGGTILRHELHSLAAELPEVLGRNEHQLPTAVTHSLRHPVLTSFFSASLPHSPICLGSLSR